MKRGDIFYYKRGKKWTRHKILSVHPEFHAITAVAVNLENKSKEQPIILRDAPELWLNESQLLDAREDEARQRRQAAYRMKLEDYARAIKRIQNLKMRLDRYTVALAMRVRPLTAKKWMKLAAESKLVELPEWY